MKSHVLIEYDFHFSKQTHGNVQVIYTTIQYVTILITL